MNHSNEEFAAIKYLSPKNLYDQLEKFTAGMAVTKGSYELTIPRCTLEDIEWNHMDQMHRPTIHNTYEKGVRIACGRDFAFSLTEWKKWPFFIPVTDMYVAKGLFYQSLTLAGVIFVHSIISMEPVGDSVKLKDEWYIASRKIFKFLHRFLDKKLYALNARLQQEDEQVRQGRFELRKKGYHFRTDTPNYYNSNLLGNNTIYPALEKDAIFYIDDVTETPTIKKCGQLEFIVKKVAQGYHVWPAACPHEGGPLMNGQFCETKITCPWHGLHFAAAELTKEMPIATKHGFEYFLENQQIFVKQNSVSDIRCRLKENNVT